MTSNAQSTSALVCINSVEIHPVAFNGQRVLTFAQIDKVHARPKGTAKRNFTENKSRLIEGQDFHLVDSSKKYEFRTFGIEVPPRGLTVVTESGYLLLVKSFTDDLAWQIQRELVNAYFRLNPERTVGERYDTLIPSEQQLLHEAVDARTAALSDGVKGKAKAEIWSRVHRRFRVAKYSQLPRTQIMDAILYITRMELRCAPTPPVADPRAYKRISRAQQKQLADAVSRAMTGWVFSGEHNQHVYNALRVIFHIEQIADLPATDFDKALLVVEQIRDMNDQFLTWLCDVRQSYIQEYVMAGSPWTPWLKREWRKQMQTALPARPHWIEIMKQLDMKIPAAVN